MRRKIFSGEPLPIAPAIEDAELSAFHRKVLDYLRRLAGKIDQFGDGGGGDGADGNVLVFAAYKDTTDTFSDTTQTPVPWDVVIRKDSIFNFSASSAIIQVTEAGFYVIEVDLMPLKNVLFYAYVSKVDAGGVATDDVDYGDGGFPITGAAVGDQGGSMMVPLMLDANDRFSIFAKSQTGTGDNTWVTRGCRILVSRISAEVT